MPDPAGAGPLGTGRRDGSEACGVLHVDMDAFFAAVELLARPDLVGLPVAVGGSGTRGVVLSATYEARAFGVRSAMPVLRARRLCPDLVVLPADMSAYTRASRGVMELLAQISPLVEQLSVDEAFLDVRGTRRSTGTPAEVAALVKARIADEQGLPCTVGVAATKFLAKLASQRGKPDGLLVVPPERTVAFLHPLPVTALWGVGDKTAETLQRLGLRTVGDVATAGEPVLRRALGPAAGAHLSALAWGRDARPVVPQEREKSTGAEETFGRDVDDPVVLRRELLRLSERVAGRLRSAGHLGRTVVLKVRFADMTTITRSRTLAGPTDTGRVVYKTARELFDALGLQRARVRLVGVRCEGLLPVDGTPLQLTLAQQDTAAGAEEWRRAEQAADDAARRFGAGAVRPAALVGPSAGPRAVGRGDRPGSPAEARERDASPGRRSDGWTDSAST